MQLSPLQSRVLELLAGVEPPWTLTGGGALAGFHLGHRTTRDLDLFFIGQASIAEVRRDVTARLDTAGLDVKQLRTGDAFTALRVAGEGEVVIVDLVAEPVASIEEPRRIDHRGVSILVDTPHEVLVNKLCTLLHRSELRDLVDIQALLASGGDLDRAVADAPRKDGGFSALTLSYTLEGWGVGDAARAAGMADRADELDRFRSDLLDRVAGDRP